MADLTQALGCGSLLTCVEDGAVAWLSHAFRHEMEEVPAPEGWDLSDEFPEPTPISLAVHNMPALE